MGGFRSEMPISFPPHPATKAAIFEEVMRSYSQLFAPCTSKIGTYVIPYSPSHAFTTHITRSGRVYQGLLGSTNKGKATQDPSQSIAPHNLIHPSGWPEGDKVLEQLRKTQANISL